MWSTISPAFVARGSDRRRTLARPLVAIALASAIVTLAACGGGGGPTAIVDTTPDTSTLAGTWNGSLDGGSSPNSYGPSTLSMTLKADSTLTVTASNPAYCALVNATWRVTGANFTAGGRDCDGIIVAFAAPVAALRLTGTWTATSGRSGGFTVAKQ